LMVAGAATLYFPETWYPEETQWQLATEKDIPGIQGGLSGLTWDQSMLDYLDKNHFDEVYKGPGDNFFGTLSASRPEIYSVYWS
ncbi:hypothetical protein MJM59_33430, partial [Salmonella enterica subsp. enterica serovar Montevideo]|nr:hypothetical protein [Salmonella enterica subsp. enterica serovar Montevideo]